MLAATGAMGALNFRNLVNASDYSPNDACRRPVIIELAGANDGLNTLVPYVNDRYYALRPTLAFKSKNVIPLADSQGGGIRN